MAGKYYQQVFEKQLRSVQLAPQLLLFTRFHWSAGSSSLIVLRPESFVKDLPGDWENFNVFSDDNDKKDPSVDPEHLDPTIKNPVTSDMITLYRYWKPEDTVFKTKSKSNAKTKWVIDYACWQGSINGFPNFQFACGPDKDLIEQQMYDSWFEHYGFPTDRSLFKVFLSDGIHSIAPPPSTEFWNVSAASVADGHPPWTAHEEPDGDANETVVECDAVMIMNVRKMRGAQKEDPVTKKKPDTLEFTVSVPNNYDKEKTSAGFKLEVGLYKTTKPSIPPKDDDGRKDFPLVDKVVTGEMQYLVPDWSPFPKADHTNDVEIAGFPDSDDKIRVKIKFANVPVGKIPTVELIREGGTGAQ